jgi:hypothetical protein
LYGNRRCARPGCGARAAATLRFQPTRREAWLVDLDEDSARTEGDLCARHAAALTLPRGWELHDERTHSVEDAPPPQPRPKKARVKRKLKVVRPPAPAPQPELMFEPEPEPESEPEPEPDAESLEESLEADDQPEVIGEKLTDVLDARSPLLKRAFQNVTPPPEQTS